MLLKMLRGSKFTKQQDVIYLSNEKKYLAAEFQKGRLNLEAHHSEFLSKVIDSVNNHNNLFRSHYEHLIRSQ